MISTVEKVLFLKRVDLFSSLHGEELSGIAEIAEEVSFYRGDTIVDEGDEGDALYLIIQGKVRVHSGEKTLAELASRQCFGEMSLLDSEPRSASVTSLGDLTALKIHRDDFSEILLEKPEIAKGVIRVLTRRLREANRRQ